MKKYRTPRLSGIIKSRAQSRSWVIILCERKKLGISLCLFLYSNYGTHCFWLLLKSDYNNSVHKHHCFRAIDHKHNNITTVFTNSTVSKEWEITNFPVHKNQCSQASVFRSNQCLQVSMFTSISVHKHHYSQFPLWTYSRYTGCFYICPDPKNSKEYNANTLLLINFVSIEGLLFWNFVFLTKHVSYIRLKSK